MPEYINRLVKCGHTEEKATEIYMDYLKNFSIAELDIYVRYVEGMHDVEKV